MKACTKCGAVMAINCSIDGCPNKGQLDHIEEELSQLESELTKLKNRQNYLEGLKKHLLDYDKSEKIRLCEESGGHEYYHVNAKWQPVGWMKCYHCPHEIGR